MMFTLHWLWPDFRSPLHRLPERMKQALQSEQWLLLPWHPQWLKGATACHGPVSTPRHSWRGEGAALLGGAGSGGWRFLHLPCSRGGAAPVARAAAAGKWCTAKCSRQRSHDAGSSPSGCGAPWWVQLASRSQHWPGPNPDLHPCMEREDGYLTWVQLKTSAQVL